MADSTYTQALAANELVPGTPGAGQEQITGAEIVGATSGTAVDSGWTFNNLKAWIKLDADWMSRAVYDADDDGIVDGAESLNDGTNTASAVEVRSHIDNATIHFPLNDGVVSAGVAWSGSYLDGRFNAISEFPEAPQDGTPYSRQDAAWVTSPLTPIGGMFLRYDWSTNTAATDPGIGNIKCNNADFKLATAIYVSATTRSGNSAEPVWSEWKQGDYITLQHDTDGTNNAYEISGPIVDNSTWYSVPVTPIPGGTGTLANGAPVTSTQVLDPGSRLPIGGTIGQALTKSSNTNYDVGWSDVGDVVGPASAVDQNLAVFSGTTGKLIADGSLAVSAVLATSVANQFTMANKATPVNADRILLEDSEAAGAKRYITWSQLPAGGGGSKHVIQDEGTPLTDRAGLNFQGATVTAQDNAGQDRTDVIISAIDASGVTFENLDANGDVGTGAAQVSQGDHLHPGVYDPAGSAAAVQTNLDTHIGDDTNPHSVTAAQAGAEPALGNPASDGQVLSSTAAGVRSWTTAGIGNVVTPDAAAEGSTNITHVVGLTQAEYDASVQDANTLYVIVG